jgi:hypothetical protein
VYPILTPEHILALSDLCLLASNNDLPMDAHTAWSVIYLFLHGRDSWRHTFARPPRTKASLFPISLSALALSNAVIHGYVYWSGFYRDPLSEDVEKK